MEYTFLQTIIFFFIYCFLGWIWETGYVSLCKHRFVNRGFLHGPLIPIYGFGAMTILFATLPLKGNGILVFLGGIIASTVLELTTGCVMEWLFHVRYWDYTNIPTNIRGYVSLPTSIVWGILSLLIVYGIHTPIERFVLGISRVQTEVVAMLFLSLGSMDLALSVREALDLKEILENISELEHMYRRREQNRVNMIVALLDSDLEKMRERIEMRVNAMGNGEKKRIRSILMRNPSARSARYEQIFEEFRDALNRHKKRDDI